MDQNIEQRRMQMAGATHIGRVRPSNQDHYLIADMRRLLNIRDSSLPQLDGNALVGWQPGELLMVADGMGGYAHGGRASQLAIQQMAIHLRDLICEFHNLHSSNDAEFRKALKKAPVRIQQMLQQEGKADPDKSQMGTTLTAVYVSWPDFYLLHVGDSCCFLFRDGKLRQLTKDHTLAQSLIDAGIKKEDIPYNSYHHVLSNSISASDAEPKPDLIRDRLKPGDVLLLSTDGLTRHVSSEEIAAVMESGDSAADRCAQLIELANSRGGHDNITVVIADCTASASASSTTDAPGLEDDADYELLAALADTDIGYPAAL
ncbi:MAG: protein phosphatase 2C domain-containing protein [Fuerstiella sp.]